MDKKDKKITCVDCGAEFLLMNQKDVKLVEMLKKLLKTNNY